MPADGPTAALADVAELRPALSVTITVTEYVPGFG